jgi:cyclophilin family peptidyl-prolyl cis-trans isomerase
MTRQRANGSRRAVTTFGLISVAAVALIGAACARPNYPAGLYAEVTTNKGLIVLKLEFEKAPMTVANFVGLAEGTIDNAASPAGAPYFDNTKWHRVVPGHVIQSGMGGGGKAEGPGYEFPNEIVLPDLNHGRAGMVGMANGGPHTNGSQWYITLGDRSYLDGDYTVFGSVFAGLDVVNAIVQGDDVRTVRIVRIGPAARAFRPTTASFLAMVEEARARVAKEEAEKKARGDDYVQAYWPAAVEAGDGLKYLIVRLGSGRPPAQGDTVRVAYTGQAPLAGKSFVSTSDRGQPFWGETPETFEMVVGEPGVTPGLDRAIAAMAKGEKRVVIVPPALGYGTNGFYAKQRPGERRFVISPNTLLVYQVELFDIKKGT